MAVLPHPSEVIPHRGSAVLIDAIEKHDADETTCTARVNEAMQYVQEGKADAALALELMAQTIAVHVGLEGRWADAAPRAGYVVGIPKMRFSGGDYSVGDELSISVRVVFHEGPVGRFEGAVRKADQLRAEGALTVFEPPLAEETSGSEETKND